MADFQWAFGLNRLSLDMIGIWPAYVRKSGKDQTSSYFKQIRGPTMVIWMLVGLVAPQIYALTYVYGELALVVDNLTTTCTTLTSSIKLFFLWNNRHLLRPIVQKVSADWNRATRSKFEHELMSKQARRARMFTISGYTIMFFCFAGFITTPFFGLSIRIINNLTDPQAATRGRYFPLQTSYPFDAFSSPYFQIIYATQIIAGSFVAISFSVPDNFFGALVFHASAQCQILEAKLRQLVPDNPELIRRWIDKSDQSQFRANFRRLIQLHVHLVGFVELLEKSFNLLILAQVVCLSIILCCLGFGVITSMGHESASPPITQIITLAGTLLNLMIHMLVYCIASEILAQHSSGLSYALYSCNWYHLPAKYSRDIIPMMTRAQLPLKLTAGKFFNLSLNAYLSIMKTAAGYVSMLLTVSN